MARTVQPNNWDKQQNRVNERKEKDEESRQREGEIERRGVRLETDHSGRSQRIVAVSKWICSVILISNRIDNNNTNAYYDR